MSAPAAVILTLVALEEPEAPESLADLLAQMVEHAVSRERDIAEAAAVEAG